MSTENDDGDSTPSDERGTSPPWTSDPLVLGPIYIVCGFVAFVAVLVILLQVEKHIKRWWRDRRAKSRKLLNDNCRELEEREEPVEDPRRSEESVGSCCESEEPVEAKASSIF